VNFGIAVGKEQDLVALVGVALRNEGVADWIHRDRLYALFLNGGALRKIRVADAIRYY
jgi:hypothetical protein